jgi:ABC-type branched-subunit amino acid transport system substrate-binding protein
MRNLTLALLVTCTGCGNSNNSMSSDPVAVGVLTATTGDLAGLGRDLSDSTNLAFSEINDAGGLLGGRQLKVVLEDDGTTPEGAKAGYSALLVDAVPAIIGPTTSAQVISIADQLRTGGTLTIGSDTTSPGLTTLDKGGNFFRVPPSDSIQGIVLGQLIAASGRKNLCIVERGDVYGMALEASVTGELQKLSPTVNVVVASYDPAMTDLSGVMQACEGVRTMPNTAVLFITFVADGALIIDDAAKRGWNTTDHKVFLCDGNKDPGLLQLVSNLQLIEGAIGTASSGPDPSGPEGALFHDFLEKFRGKFSRDPGPYAEYAYDAAYLVAIAIQLSGGTTDHPKIVQQMAAITSGTTVEQPGGWKMLLDDSAAGKSIAFKGTTGLKHFDPMTGDLLPPYYMGEWTITNGTITSVKVYTCDPTAMPPCQ